MNRYSLEKWQATQIDNDLFGPLNYLFRLKARMEETGFPPDDPAYLKTVAAYNAVLALRVEIHYLACDGAGRPSVRAIDEPASKDPAGESDRIGRT